jgi:hypothetical protein
MSVLRAGRALPPERSSDTHFCRKLSKSLGYARPEGLGKLKKKKKKISDLNGARTRDFPACRMAPQPYTVDSRLSARGLTALRLNRGNVFLKKKFYFP